MPILKAREEGALLGQLRFDKTIVALVIAGMATFIDVYTTQALLPYLRKVYHATELEVSLTISATTLAVAIVAPFIGVFAESIGRKRVIVPAIFGLSIPTYLAATSPSLHMLIIWRFAQGIFIPGIIAVVMAYINEEWAERGVGVAMSAYVSGTVAGGFIGRLIPGIITTRFQWRDSFLVLGTLTLIGGFVVLKWLPKAENFVPNPNIRASLVDAVGHLRNPRLLANFVMGFTVLFQLVGAFTYASFYLAEKPFFLTSAQLGSIFFVYLLGLLVTPAAGHFLDRNGFLKTVMLALIMTFAGLLCTTVKVLPVIIVGLAVFSSGVFVLQATASSQTGKAAGRSRSSAAGLYVTFYYAGGSVGAVLPAWAWRAWGWPGCVVLFMAAGCLTFLLGWATEPRS